MFSNLEVDADKEHIEITILCSPLHFLPEEAVMERQCYKPIRFTLENRLSMINLYYALELKFFMQTLLHSGTDKLS